jgi:hypothetical protein
MRVSLRNIAIVVGFTFPQGITPTPLVWQVRDQKSKGRYTRFVLALDSPWGCLRLSDCLSGFARVPPLPGRCESSLGMR